VPVAVEQIEEPFPFDAYSFAMRPIARPVHGTMAVPVFDGAEQTFAELQATIE